MTLPYDGIRNKFSVIARDPERSRRGPWQSPSSFRNVHEIATPVCSLTRNDKAVKTYNGFRATS